MKKTSYKLRNTEKYRLREISNCSKKYIELIKSREIQSTLTETEKYGSTQINISNILNW